MRNGGSLQRRQVRNGGFDVLPGHWSQTKAEALDPLVSPPWD